MITRQDLEDCRFREIEIEQRFEKIKMWQNSLNRIQASYSNVRKVAFDEFDSVNCFIRQIIKDTLSEIKFLSMKYKDVELAIESIPDPMIRAVMKQYYILGASDWNEVAAILGISRRSVHRLHGYGLEILKRMQDKTSIKQQ